jgi:hypothetical protein
MDDESLLVVKQLRMRFKKLWCALTGLYQSLTANIVSVPGCTESCTTYVLMKRLDVAETVRRWTGSPLNLQLAWMPPVLKMS